MNVRTIWLSAALSALLVGSVYWTPGTSAQEPVSPPVRRPEPQTTGGFVPGQKRPPIDPVILAHGKALYGINCQACHGSDLRGGDLGGPNLLRSQVTLSDQNGELIVPIIQGSRQAQGMPNIGLNNDDAKAVAAYVRSVIGQIGTQGKPPGESKPLNIVTGDPVAGKAYFTATCAKCHSDSGSLNGIASRITDAKALQQAWLIGGTRGGNSAAAMAKVAVTLPSGETADGTLVHLDDFLVSLKLSNGETRSFSRIGQTPKVVVDDPLQAHKDLLPIYTDKEIHDVTAYLVTLK